MTELLRSKDNEIRAAKISVDKTQSILSRLAITGAIRGRSKEKIFEKLGLESLQHRQWYRKLCCFYEILKEQFPKYLFNIIPNLTRPYSTRNANDIPHFKVKHSFFKNTFFPSVIIE